MSTNPIIIGQEYEFHSTAMANPEVTPFSGQTVAVLSGPLPLDDPNDEPLYEVRFIDGHTASAFQGELDGYYLRTGQCVEAWKNDPVLAAQMKRDAEAWA